ncbi:Ena/VASP-like protein [Amphibalanus amphitrite]|uniref:Ena/VASP-like protein n=1 Tax=Amphibalanus amphitrite TaxID=1232801 RepID=A0A6A4VQU0_AMPAM|nr:Ena/VASP-like protein [Amphibalanus amphitrite]
MSNELSLTSGRANVMVYDDVNKKWVPAGTTNGFAKVHIYHHVVNNTYRVVGRKLQDQEVVINCAILKGLKYNQATPTFHQWRDNKRVYGLSFSSVDDANSFANTMLRAIDNLTESAQMTARSQQPTYGHAHTLPHKPSSTFQAAHPPEPAASPQRPVSSSEPPPSGLGGLGGLAAAIQNTKLKKTVVNNSDTSSCSSSGSSTYGTIGRAAGGPVMSMMDEMAATLARRKAKMTAAPSEDTAGGQEEGGPPRWERSHSTSGGSVVRPTNGGGAESPRPARKRLGSHDESRLNGLSPADQPAAAGGANAADLDALKQDILKEMRREMTAMKNDILDAIKMELNRR